MNKRLLKRTVVVLCALVIAICAMCAVACTVTPIKIEAPVLSYSQYAVSWQECDGASLYAVTIRDTSGELEEITNFAVSTYVDVINYEGKRIRISVKALSNKDSKRYTDSDIAYLTVNVGDTSLSQRNAEEDALLSFASADLGILNFTYGKKSDDGLINTRDLSIYTGGALSAEGKYLQGFDSHYDQATGYSTISAGYLQRFSAGAVVRLYTAGKEGLRQCNISITEYESPAVVNCESGVITYFKSLGGYAYLKFNFSSSFNAVYAGSNTRLSFTVAKDNMAIKLDASGLDKLSEGIHDLSIYTGAGNVYCKILIIDDYSERLEDLMVDIDDYPAIKLSWRGGAEPFYYKLKIGVNIYLSNDSNYSSLFGNCEADISDIAKQGDKVELIACFEDGNELSAACYVPMYEHYIPYLQERFEYIGESYNAYIDSVDEWYAAVGHTILHYDTLKDGDRLDKSIYFAVDIKGYLAANMENKFKEAITNFREIVDYVCYIRQIGENEYSIEITIKTVVTPDKSYTSLKDEYKSLIVPVFDGEVSAYLHYGSGGRDEHFDAFAINYADKTARVSGSDELYFAIEAGYRPIAEAGSSADRMYNAAKSVLRRIIDDNMNDYEKVHAIADYLTGEIAYDSAVAKLESELQGTSGYSAIYSYNCFFLEGVFDDGVAVCNGLSKAFVVLCGIEGIPAVKIQGYTNLFPRSGRHAWNKVYLGGQWYGVDTTWGYVVDGSVRYVSHNYTFMSSSALNSTSHYQDENVLGSNYYCGDTSYNFYSDLTYFDGDNLCDHIVGNKSELQALLSYYTANYGGDKLIVYAYVNDIFTAKSITLTDDNYRVKTINGKGGKEYIYILEKL